jgi:hypothetical protein
VRCLAVAGVLGRLGAGRAGRAGLALGRAALVRVCGVVRMPIRREKRGCTR